MDQRLLDAEIGVLQLDIFADDADIDLVFGAAQLGDEVTPAAQAVPGFFGRGQGQPVDQELVEAGFLQAEGNLVDGVNGDHGDDSVLRDVTEESDFFLGVGVDLVV